MTVCPFFNGFLHELDSDQTKHLQCMSWCALTGMTGFILLLERERDCDFFSSNLDCPSVD